MSAGSIRLSLARIEGVHLATLMDDFIAVLSAGESDPAVERLTPAVYPDDPEASAEFASVTKNDLLSARAADAAIVRHNLRPFDDADSQDVADDTASEHLEIVIAAEEIDAWLRALTALRLVIATRLQITADDEDRDDEDPRFGVYDWLAYRLDSLITLADAIDEYAEEADNTTDE